MRISEQPDSKAPQTSPVNKSNDKSSRSIVLIGFIILLFLIFVGPSIFQLWMQHVNDSRQERKALPAQSR